MSKQIYLDYAATTPMAYEVNQAMNEFGKIDTGNPSSPHRFGQQAKILLEKARDVIAAKINCRSREIIFTSGGTESNNLALIGTLNGIKSGGRHVIISAVEHPSVIETVKYLGSIGYEISIINANRDGSLPLTVLLDTIRPDTILASVMYVNNETGIIHNMAEIAAFCQEHKIVYHCDAIQAFGKISMDFDNSGIGLLSISAHKIYGPKGIGALIVKEGIPFSNLNFGGGQEANRRPGTENLIGIVGFAKAVELLDQNKNDYTHAHQLQIYFEEKVKSEIPFTEIIGKKVNRTPFISTIAFPRVDNESMLLNLDLAGIAVSAGSACSSGSINQSHVLQAMSLPDEIIKSTIRFSYGRFTKQEDMDYTIETIKQVTERLK